MVVTVVIVIVVTIAIVVSVVTVIFVIVGIVMHNFYTVIDQNCTLFYGFVIRFTSRYTTLINHTIQCNIYSFSNIFQYNIIIVFHMCIERSLI